MILGRCIQFEHLTVHQKERKGGRWRKMRNGRSKSFALTSSPHNQSPCYCSHSLSVKSILAVNTPVVLAVCYTAAAIDQCQLDRLRCEHVKGKQSCCAIMENKKNGVSQKNKKKRGGGNDWLSCVWCTTLTKYWCLYMYSVMKCCRNMSNSAGLYRWDAICHAQKRLTALHR